MTQTRFARSATAWLGLAVTASLVQGCAQQSATWNGIYGVDAAGRAKTCVTPTVSAPDGMEASANIQVSDEGGWCGIILNHNGTSYDTYLMFTRPNHGRVYAHHVGSYTRVDYTPDAGYVGSDSFAVRLIPGDAVLRGIVTVTK